jgi:4-methyl-5(b-hydroxyethyl)-thiazole monophosphate biosynthesis
MKESFLFLADGFEEIEAVTTIDVLRRGEANLVTVSIHAGRLAVTGAHGLTIMADATLDAVAGKEACFMILPGGMPGAETLSNTPALVEWLQCHVNNEGWIAAICAAPALVLGKLQLPRRSRLTCYPGFESLLKPSHDVLAAAVVHDGNFITARGPGSAMEFGMEILAKIQGKERARTVSSDMIIE